jgi:hypothetical protein
LIFIGAPPYEKAVAGTKQRLDSNTDRQKVTQPWFDLPYTLDVDVCRRALRKHFVDTVDLYIDGTRGWSAAEADTRN